MNRNSLILLTTTAVALGGFLLGFDTAVIAGATTGMSAAFGLGALKLGFTVSCALWGTVAGVLLASPLGERWGAKVSLQWMGVLYFVSAIGCAVAWNWPWLLVFRLVGGLGIGGSSVLSPMYIAEIAPQEWRGRLVACFQVAVVIGILSAYASNDLVSHLHLLSTEWRYDLGAAVLPALLFTVAVCFIPDSPRWLIVQGRQAEAKLVMERMGIQDCGLQEVPDVPSVHSLFKRENRKVIFIAISIGVLNQLSGINAILYYLNDIFAQAGFSAANARTQAVAIGAANLVFTLLAMLLIDSIGRRFLLIVGSVGMAGCLLAISRIFATGGHKGLLLWLLITYIAFFAFSQGTVVWVYLSEIFPAGIRERGQSLGTLALWVSNGLVAALFPLLAARDGQYPFLFFSVMMVVQLLLALWVFPETKGVSLEEASSRAVA